MKVVSDTADGVLAKIATVRFRPSLWRFARLFSVGLAWSAPLLPAVFVENDPGYDYHPALARWLADCRWELFVATLALCCVGIVLISLLSWAT